MARTMSQEEHEQYMACVERAAARIKTKEDAVKFLQDVGYLDENGDVAWPYNGSGRKPKNLVGK